MSNLQQQRESSAFVFARNFFRNPKMLGSVIPSSRFLIHQLLRHVEWQRARVVVELGPGVGTITREVLRKMRPDGKLVAFEVNDDFVRHLRENFSDKRLQIEHRSGVEVAGALAQSNLGKADYVIAGIPFSILTASERDAVLSACNDSLADGGTMLVYQFSGRVRRDLERIFGRVERVFEPRNVLPAQVFRCIKGRSGNGRET